MKTALTIAGSDSSGGAGIQADIKTMTANGVFALSAITALTAQNTTGVTGIFETTPEFLAQQLDAVFTDIYPDAIKIGMVSSSALIETIAKKLRQYDAKHIVVDPVMVATSGSKLLRDDAIPALTKKLLPMAEVVTPNIPEAEILSGLTITDAAGMEALLGQYGVSVPERDLRIARSLASRLTKAKLLGTIDLLQDYRNKCTYNVGVGPTLGGFAVELEETL